MILEQRWTGIAAEQGIDEEHIVGGAERFAVAERPTGTALVKPAGAPSAVVTILDAERAATPAEPLWTGLVGASVADDAVQLSFAQRFVPRLLPIAGSNVEVSCHLFNPPTGPSDRAD